MSERIGFGLQTKLILIFLIITLIPMGVVMYIAYQRVAERFNTMAQERIKNTLQHIEEEYNNKQNELLNEVERILEARSFDIKRLLLQGPQSTLIDLAVEMREARGLDILEIGDQEGTVLAKGDERAGFGFSRGDEEEIERALKGETVTTLSRERRLGRNYLMIEAIVPIRYSSSNIGTVLGGYILDKKFAQRLKEVSSAEIIILNDDEIETSTINTSNAGESLYSYLQPLLSKIHKGGYLGTITLSQDRYNLGSVPLRATNKEILGTILIGISDKERMQTIKDMSQLFLILALGGVLIASALGYFIARGITRPIRELVRGAKAIAAGDLEHQIITRSRDEVGMLVGAFNQMATDLKENRERRIRAERLAAWREVARKVAHEIKNPLFPIQLSIQSLRSMYQANREGFEDIFDDCTTTVLEEVEVLKNLASSFSEFAKMPTLYFKLDNVNDILRSVLAPYIQDGSPSYIHTEQKVEIEADYDDNIPDTILDRKQLSQAFLNLISNALDAMDGGGKLKIKTALVSSTSGEDEIWMEFTDNGPGIPEQIRDKVFNPYFTTKKTGTGLGLAITNRIIIDHRGRIEVRSEEGKGTTFTLILPTSSS